MSRACPSCGSVYPDAVSFCGECGAITVQQQPAGDVDPRIGQRLDDYLVVARVADGAMGRVYEGRHVGTRARYAIKVLHPDVSKDAVAVERFRREYETADMLRDPHIVNVVLLGTTPDGANYMVMEYLEGEELGKVLRRDGALAPARLLRILCQCALALDHAHSFGVVHRDLKPDNIFLCHSPEGDRVRLLDFGSVKLQMETGPKLTAFGTTLGSPYYMSPEQAMGKLDVDHRTDVFAMAAIASEMATGKVAFDGANVAEILMKIVQQAPIPPSSLNPRFPHAFDDVFEAGVAKQKQNRPASVGELAKRTLEAFGLPGDVKAFAEMSTADIERALTAARPPSPKPFGADVPSAVTSSQEDFALPTRKGPNRGWVVGVVLAVVALGVAVAFLR
ncbi:MAG: serine/threonine-protein kinase [Polyangiales bacterium]